MIRLMGITWNSIRDIYRSAPQLVAVKMASNANQAIYHITIKTFTKIGIVLAGLLICD